MKRQPGKKWLMHKLCYMEKMGRLGESSREGTGQAGRQTSNQPSIQEHKRGTVEPNLFSNSFKHSSGSKETNYRHILLLLQNSTNYIPVARIHRCCSFSLFRRSTTIKRENSLKALENVNNH